MTTNDDIILLVEDDNDDAEMTLYSLRKLNLNLLHIDDGAKALQYLFENKLPEPKIILLDLKMPRVDGIQILRKLKSDPDKKHIPVVALISSQEGIKYVESCGLCANAYLTKPIDCQKFLSVVSQVGLSNSNTYDSISLSKLVN